MNGVEIDDLLEKMNRLFDNFCRCRYYFPLMPQICVGMENIKIVETGDDCSKRNMTFCFEGGFSENDRVQYKEIASWLNQNFIIRLCALIEINNPSIYEHLKQPSKNNKKRQGYKHYNLLYKLRQQLAHTDGRYEPKGIRGKEHEEILNGLISEYSLQIESEPEFFPLPIDVVIIPMFKGCLECINSFK